MTHWGFGILLAAWLGFCSPAHATKPVPAKKSTSKRAGPVVTAPLVPVTVSTPAPQVPDGSRQWIERFDGLDAGADLLKHGWNGGQEKDGKRDHSLMKENGQLFLRESYLVGTEALYLYKEFEWDVNEFPYLTWRWRVVKYPKAAKVLDSKVSDAAAQVYVLWKKGRRSFVIKYFWSAADAPGDVLNQSSFIFGRLYGLIIRNSPVAGEWYRETRNVKEDYRVAFGDYPDTKVKGIAVLSDGDETKSESEADYADFEITKQLP